MNVYQEKEEREKIKREIAQKLVEVIRGQNVNVDIALKALECAKDIILLSTNI